MSLKGRVLVITGSTRGIGRAIAEAAARDGARVVASGRTEAASKETAEFLESFSGTAIGVACDVRDAMQVAALRDTALASFGAIHVWVNNAGVTEGLIPVDEQEPQDMSDIVETNVLGTLYGARAILPYFREHGGVLFNVVGRGYEGRSTPHMAVYAATKAAIASLTRSLAEENEDRPVSVHAIAPGMVETDMHEDISVSPRVAGIEHTRHLAMEAFGNSLTSVGIRTADLLGQEPGEKTGEVYALLGRGQRYKGIAQMAWWGMTGKLRPKDEA